jgi:uncharacterized membrane protein YkgB
MAHKTWEKSKMGRFFEGFKDIDQRLTRWMADNGISLLRFSLGIVYLWFGILKFFLI